MTHDQDSTSEPNTSRAPGCGAGSDDSPSARLSEDEQVRMKERMLYIAQRRYRLRQDVADEVTEATLESYEQRLQWDDGRDDQHRVLIGLLRDRCREHIRRQLTRTAQANAVRDKMPDVDVRTAIAAGALDDIASHDARKLILEAVAELRPKAWEALQAVRTGATRLDLMDVIQNLGMNSPRNASGIRAYQTEFRQILARCGIRL